MQAFLKVNLKYIPNKNSWKLPVWHQTWLGLFVIWGVIWFLSILFYSSAFSQHRHKTPLKLLWLFLIKISVSNKGIRISSNHNHPTFVLLFRFFITFEHLEFYTPIKIRWRKKKLSYLRYYISKVSFDTILKKKVKCLSSRK